MFKFAKVCLEMCVRKHSLDANEEYMPADNILTW